MRRRIRDARLRQLLRLVLGGAVLISATLVLADEGMWTFDNPPTKNLKERYGFTPTPEWLDHVRLSSVRFNDGGSGSFVSPHGLVLTNHHVARGQLQKVSSAQKDYVKDGFYAKTQAEEMKCPDLEVNVLVSMENVTDQVVGAVRPGMSDQEALKARKAIMARIQNDSLKATGLRSDVIPLYRGGEYWVYRYKKYTDMRLVFAPEQQAAFFGGDPDNFTFPRHDVDMALFRVYENGKPVESANYLKWNAKGPAEGDLVFVSGHPGSTNRTYTSTQLAYWRDQYYPLRIKLAKERVDALRTYSARGPEQTREAEGTIWGLMNALKAWTGEYEGLQDKVLMAKKQKEESTFRERVAGNPEWSKEYGGAWDAIAQATVKRQEMLKATQFRVLRGSRMAGMALTIVQYVAEIKKPDGTRLDGYHDSQLESLRFLLFSPAPVYPQMEEWMLATGLKGSAAELGPNDPFVQAALNGRAYDEVAKEAIGGTKLADPAFRKSLVEGGQAAVNASTDPLIVVARRFDPVLRQMTKWMEDNVESLETPAEEKIGRARFAVYGKSEYPDATFTLRLSYGVAKGFPMNGTNAPYKTTLYGLYDRALSFDLKSPYDMPARFMERRSGVDLATPLNFVSTCDIIGGNSGSPVIDREGQLIGLIFDGNIESLVGRFVYDDSTNRAVAVHAAVMIEVLRKLYDAGALADELMQQ